jgi:hypothetical protein
MGNAQPSDREATTAIVESIKAFFAGTMATRGRRTDLNRNVFYAAAEAVTPKGLREKKRIRAVVRLTGLRHDDIYLQGRRVPQRDGRQQVATSGARVGTLKWPFTWVNTAA